MPGFMMGHGMKGYLTSLDKALEISRKRTAADTDFHSARLIVGNKKTEVTHNKNDDEDEAWFVFRAELEPIHARPRGSQRIDDISYKSSSGIMRTSKKNAYDFLTEDERKSPLWEPIIYTENSTVRELLPPDYHGEE